MNELVLNKKNILLFVEFVFGKPKKVIIFASALRENANLLEKWQSGRLRQS